MGPAQEFEMVLCLSSQVSEEDKQRASGAWFPYPTLEALSHALRDAGQESPVLQSLSSHYEDALRRHRELAVQESDALEQRQQY